MGFPGIRQPVNRSEPYRRENDLPPPYYSHQGARVPVNSSVPFARYCAPTAYCHSRPLASRSFVSVSASGCNSTTAKVAGFALALFLTVAFLALLLLLV